MARTAEVVRETKETQIRVWIDLDGTGASTISTGIGFYDHMLESFARHGGFDLKVETRKGAVQLSGFVENQAQVERAIAAADRQQRFFRIIVAARHRAQCPDPSRHPVPASSRRWQSPF